MRGFFRTVAALGIVGFLTPVVCAAVVLGTLVFLPLPATLPEVQPGLESRITHLLDADGNEIAVFREFETSIPVQPADIPQLLKDAVISTEDRGFYSHGGIDLRGTIRALWADVRQGGAVQGGSTITQQYVRLAFEEVGTERTISRKIREAILASQLDRQYPKDEILFGYLSSVYLGEGAYGVGAAAETYFRKPVSQLTLSEAALLVGVIPAPTVYSPRDNPEGAESKRQLVLGNMLSEGYIAQADYDAAIAQPLWLAANGAAPGPATVVYPPITQQSARPWFTDYVRRWLEVNLEGCAPGVCDAIYRGGLTVETTLDPRAQDAADAAVARMLEGTDPTLQMALVAVEPPTGFVRAMVGGHDFLANQVNTALGAAGGGTDRQTGSAFKPFVLATAFEQGIQPTTVYSGAPHDVSQPCGGQQVLGNYGGARYGSLPLRQATWNSVNTIFTRLILDVGVEQTMDLANRLGAGVPAYDPGVHCASVALGALESSPLHMASAFGVFANHGRRAEPTPVLRVIGPDGTVWIDNTEAQDEAEQVLAPEVADNVTDVLRGVLTDGTAAGKGIGRPAAGKTGTTENNRNAWFVGFTPGLSTAVWMGYLDQSIELTRIRGVRTVTGGTLPAQTWQRFMNDALEGVDPAEFDEPAPIPDVRDAARRSQRGGFDPGRRRAPDAGLAADGFVEEEQAPTVSAPDTTTTTEPNSSTTHPTSTTRPPVTILPN